MDNGLSDFQEASGIQSRSCQKQWWKICCRIWFCLNINYEKRKTKISKMKLKFGPVISLEKIKQEIISLILVMWLKYHLWPVSKILNLNKFQLSRTLWEWNLIQWYSRQNTTKDEFNALVMWLLRNFLIS